MRARNAWVGVILFTAACAGASSPARRSAPSRGRPTADVAKNPTRSFARAGDDFASLAGIAASRVVVEVTCGTVAQRLCPAVASDEATKDRAPALAVASRCLRGGDDNEREDARAGLLSCLITDDDGLRGEIGDALVSAGVLSREAASLIPSRTEVDVRARRALVRDGHAWFDPRRAHCRAATPRGPETLFIRCETRQSASCEREESATHVMFEVQRLGFRVIGVGSIQLAPRIAVEHCE